MSNLCKSDIEKLRSRAWCLTIPNPLPSDLDALKKLKYKYIIIGEETCPSTNTPHYQIYTNLSSAQTFKALKKKLPRAHIEVAKGTAQQNQIYCSKQSTLYEDGDLPAQGKRNDITLMKDIIETGGSMAECLEHATNYQTIKVAEQLLKYKEKPRNYKPFVEWIHGATGTGKSKYAYETLNEPYTAMSTAKWWDGYDAHENVIIDDMRKDFCKFHELLRLLDRYEYRIETKGGTRQFRAKHIIITSCYSPTEMFDTREDINQLLRRIDTIKHLQADA